MIQRLMRLTALVVLLPLGGCLASVQSYLYPRVDMVDTKPAPPPAPPAAVAPPVTGSLFSATTYRPLFEDRRARLVGDTLTVNIIEKVTATAKSTSTVDKSGSVEAGITALPLVKSLTRAGASGTGSNTFEGKGTTESSNDFTGTITVIVREVLPNGHLIVAGEKQIGVNNSVDSLRFSGLVDPRNILADNSVQSAQIANVRLEQRGRGAQADAQVMGWLGRVFLSVLPI